MTYAAIISTFRGTGRPDSIRIRKVRDGNSIEDTFPMEFHDGCFAVGVFDTREEAEAQAERAWRENVTVDQDGYVQWA